MLFGSPFSNAILLKAMYHIFMIIISIHLLHLGEKIMNDFGVARFLVSFATNWGEVTYHCVVKLL